MRSFKQLLTTHSLCVALLAAASLPITLVAHAGPAEHARSSMNSMSSSLAKRLAEIGDYFADGSGHIGITTTDTGETLYISTSEDQDPFSLYVTGQDVSDDATLAACSLSSTGGLNVCDEAYGETLLFTLEDLQAEEADPAGFTIKCHVLGSGGTGHCMVTWGDGSASCYVCSGGRCEKTHC